ncbi:hypothetical protein LWI29_030929 [Acer saccharum]|uniref:Uncharacterized protein n=1 Tax=Acer saccharum TaxID=4024 RepID=A0AA39SNW5_ACESA|nr:hypothetical protein LWI29_030929 [Acer saccharum]
MFGELKFKGELDDDSKPVELKEEKRREVKWGLKRRKMRLRLWVVLVVEVKPNLFSGEAERFFLKMLVGTGILSPLVSSRLLPCLEEAWPVILQAAALDAVPMNSDGKGYSRTAAENNIWI